MADALLMSQYRPHKQGGTTAMERHQSSYALSSMADCGSPDSHVSPGAMFLDRVESAFWDQVDYVSDDSRERSVEQDDISGLADGAVPIYTHEVWSVFVDLGAYNEDASEMGADASDMEQAAKVCLYMIAERLLYALKQEHDESLAELAEEDED